MSLGRGNWRRCAGWNSLYEV